MQNQHVTAVNAKEKSMKVNKRTTETNETFSQTKKPKKDMCMESQKKEKPPKKEREPKTSWSCEICNEVFSKYTTLYSHRRKHENVISCTCCEEKFRTIQARNNHFWQTQHPEQEEETKEEAEKDKEEDSSSDSSDSDDESEKSEEEEENEVEEEQPQEEKPVEADELWQPTIIKKATW